MANKPAPKPKAVKPVVKSKAAKPVAKPADKSAAKPKAEKPVSDKTHKFMHVIDYADDKGEYAGSARVDDPSPAAIVNQMNQMKGDGLNPTLRIAYTPLPKAEAKANLTPKSDPMKKSTTPTKQGVKRRAAVSPDIKS